MRITALQAELAALMLERDKLRDQRSLVRLLPPEVLARIFELSVHADPYFLTSLHLVSALWRTTALATPALSSYITLDSRVGYGRIAVFLEHVKQVLERSGAASLHIDLDFRYAESLEELEQVLGALAPHLARAFAFRVSVPDWEWLAEVKKHTVALGPALEELYIRIDPSDSDDQEPALFLDAERLFPRLSRLTLEQAPLLTVREAVLPRLTTLKISRDQRYHSSSKMNVSLREVLRAIAANPGLTKLHFKGVRFQLDGSESFFSFSPILTPAPALSTMTIAHCEAAHVSILLSSLSLPSLSRLILHMDTAEEESLACLAAVAQRPNAFPLLRSLDLRNVNVNEASLLPLVQTLRALPRLSALGICNPPSGVAGPKFFDLLSRPCEPPSLPLLLDPTSPLEQHRQPSRWLVPELRALSLQNCRDVSGHEVLRVLRARIGGAEAEDEYGRKREPEVEKIKYVRMNQCFGVEEEMVESIRGVVDTLKI